MPDLHFDDSFLSHVKKFTRRDQKRSTALQKALRLFRENPHHPSLHCEKLKGSNIWTIRIDQANRLFFRWEDNQRVALFFFVGPHDTNKIINK